MLLPEPDPFAQQPLDSEMLFGLSENPFNPRRFNNIDKRALDRLWNDPLALDEHPALEPLFVAEAGPFYAQLSHFAGRLKAAGYGFVDNPRLGSESFVFRVVGPSGSGKSTLTNYLVAKLKSCAPNDDLLIIKESVRPAKIVAALERVRTRTKAYGGELSILVFDDVWLKTEDVLHDLFEELRDDMTVVMFELALSAKLV